MKMTKMFILFLLFINLVSCGLICKYDRKLQIDDEITKIEVYYGEKDSDLFVYEFSNEKLINDFLKDLDDIKFCNCSNDEPKSRFLFFKLCKNDGDYIIIDDENTKLNDFHCSTKSLEHLLNRYYYNLV